MCKGGKRITTKIYHYGHQSNQTIPMYFLDAEERKTIALFAITCMFH